MRVVWSLVASITSVVAGLVTLAPTLLLYRYIGDARIGGQDVYGYPTRRDFYDWELVLFEVVFFCSVLGAAAGTVAVSAWLARRLGGSMRGTIACTLFLLGVATWPLLIYASAVNCGIIHDFPLPFNCD